MAVRDKILCSIGVHFSDVEIHQTNLKGVRGGMSDALWGRLVIICDCGKIKLLPDHLEMPNSFLIDESNWS